MAGGSRVTLVRIVKNYRWNGYEITRQTPGGDGVWGDVTFTLEPVEACDFLVVLNHPTEEVRVLCPPEHVWALMQEPDLPELMPWLREGHRTYARVYTPHAGGTDPKYVASQTCLPWFDGDRNCSFADLVARGMPNKDRSISWVTSNQGYFPGHRPRLEFLRRILAERRVQVDVFGRGIRPIPDKWDGVAPYEYSLAIENSRTPHYWTEKLADCFLAYTLPFYCGCTNLDRYFPPRAYIPIDIDDYDGCIRRIAAAVEGDEWRGRLDAIREARELVLHRYQLFPFLAERIAAERPGIPRPIHLEPYRPSSQRSWLRRLIRRR